MADALRILVTGSRHWTDRGLVESALDAQVRAYGLADQPSRVTLVHGAAPGADTLADGVARERGWTVHEYPADWSRYGRDAGPIRNAHMVSLGADTCIGFPLPDSRGTWDCMSKADGASIPVVTVADYLTGADDG